MSFTALLTSATITENFTITGTTQQYILDLPAGTIFNGSITTTGLVRVWVNDANGSIVANLGIFDQNAQLNFVAAKEGNYTINFEDDLPNTIQVTVSYQTDPELQTDSSSLLPYVYLPVFVVVTVAGVVLILFFSRKNRKNSNK